MNDTNNTTGSINLTMPMDKCEVTAKLRANFDHIHSRSAGMFAIEAARLEDKFKDKNPSQEILNSHMSYISSSLICSVAELEANINQIIVDLQSDKKLNKALHFQTIDKTTKLINSKSLFKTLSEINKPVTSKYKLIYFLLTEKDLPHNQFAQAIQFLINIRNCLIHFTPEWSNELNRHKKLKDNYNSKYINAFHLSPFASKGALFFPYQLLSADCAVWACQASHDYIENFTKQCPLK